MLRSVRSQAVCGYCRHSQANRAWVAVPAVMAIDTLAFAGISNVPDEVHVPPDVAQLTAAMLVPFTRRAMVTSPLTVRTLRFCASQESEVLGHRLSTALSVGLATDPPLTDPNLLIPGALILPVKTPTVVVPPADPAGP